jgi:hypothetical protein
LKHLKYAIANPDGNWYQLMKSVWTDIDSGVRKTLFENFFINAIFLAVPLKTK